MKKKHVDFSIDDRGLPVSHYGMKKGVKVGDQRSITAVCAKGLDYWNQYLRPADEEPELVSYNWETYPGYRRARPRDAADARRRMLNCADWLLENRIVRDACSVWEYTYPFPSYGIDPPWRSAHAQASAIRLLLRAHRVSGDNAYRDCALSALPPFEIPLADGGFLEKITEGEWWYAKFAHPGIKCPRILNGMMFALLGLHDLAEKQNNPHAQRLFKKGIPTVLRVLPDYDAGTWSNYDRYGKPAPEMYHVIHVTQLKLLYDITGEQAFLDYHRKFESYYRRFALLRKVKGAVRSRVSSMLGLFRRG